jgi:hypothetical protein
MQARYCRAVERRTYQRPPSAKLSAAGRFVHEGIRKTGDLYLTGRLSTFASSGAVTFSLHAYATVLAPAKLAAG